VRLDTAEPDIYTMVCGVTHGNPATLSLPRSNPDAWKDAVTIGCGGVWKYGPKVRLDTVAEPNIYTMICGVTHGNPATLSLPNGNPATWKDAVIIGSGGVWKYGPRNLEKALMKMSKRVAVIGAGVSGLAAIKSCVDEGLVPVCLERTDDVGGLWRYREKVDDADSCVMKTTISNTSKEMSAFSDFPPAKGTHNGRIGDLPNFLPHAHFLRYIRDYADHFRLHKYIRYNTEVREVRRADDFADTGRWRVQKTSYTTASDVFKCLKS
ncbi:hypothetical protein BaRGS_00011317, partial [Batillaria attramentaria]